MRIPERSSIETETSSTILSHEFETRKIEDDDEILQDEDGASIETKATESFIDNSNLNLGDLKPSLEVRILKTS